MGTLTDLRLLLLIVVLNKIVFVCLHLQVAGGRIQDRGGGREEEEDGEGLQPAC